MYVQRVVLESIRGFKELDFNFERNGTYSGWNVITGDNGSGKTAFLKSLALALVGPESSRILQPATGDWIKQGESSGTIAAQLVAGPFDRFTQGPKFDRPFWAELNLQAESKGVVLRTGQKYLGGKRGPTRGPWQETPEGWFCVGYGPFRRLYGHSPEAQRLMSTPGKVSRFATLFREDATLSEGDLWLRELQYKQYEGDLLAKQTLEIVLQLLNHQFLQHGIEAQHVTSDGLLVRQKDGTSLLLGSLSDGYRSAIATLVDIIKQLIDVYGLKGFSEGADKTPQIAHTGIVLIDEVDAHLHPAWQRQIGEWFKKVLPNMQFIVTTHSPLVCQAASDRGIYHLPAPGSDRAPFQLAALDYENVIAGRPNEIYLGPAFGLDHTRSPKAVAAREQYARLQAQKRVRQLTFREMQVERQLQLFVQSETDEKDNENPT